MAEKSKSKTEQKIKTLEDLKLDPSINLFEKLKKYSESDEYKYQEKLTLKLDKLGEVGTNFDQNIINEIVLWKVNRYVGLNEDVLSSINKISIHHDQIDEPLTKKILHELLKIDGVRLAMASTILRFRNPKIYQIIDQRVVRLMYPKNDNSQKPYLRHLGNLKNKKDEVKNEAIAFYLAYLEKIRSECSAFGLDFENADRIFYLLDQDEEINKYANLKGYGNKEPSSD